jgi:hypothetical protein
MKKGLLSLLAVALTIVSCQNYDDQFAELTTLVTNLQTDVDGLSTVKNDLATLSNTVNGLATAASVEGLAQGLSDAQTAIASLTAELGDVASAEQLEAVSLALIEVQADVDELLSKNAVINQTVTINNEATLIYAETLISSATDAPNVIINGGLVITLTTTNFDAAMLARVDLITPKIATVLGAAGVSISNTSTPVHTVLVPNLSFIDGDYTVTGAPADDSGLRTISGDLTIDHKGAADYSQITTIGGDVEINNAVTSIDLSGAEVAGGINSTGSGLGIISFAKATAVNVGTSMVHTVNLPLAVGTVNLGYIGAVTSNVSITTPKATRVDFGAKTVTGTLEVAAKTGTSGTAFYASALTYTLGAATVSASEAHFGSLTGFGGNSSITAPAVDFSSLTQTATGTLVLTNATAFSAPKLTVTGNVTATAAKTVEVKSSSNANLILPAVTTLTINTLGVKTDFASAGYTTLTTLNVGGGEGKAPFISTVTNTLDIQNTALKTLNITGGDFDTVSISGTTGLTALSTAGEIKDFTLNGATTLTAATIGHAHLEGSDAARFVVTGNTLLAGLTTTALDEVGNIDISGNAALAAIDLSSLATLPQLGSYTVTITSNKLTGGFVAATAGSTTTVFVEAIVKSNDLMTIMPYFTLSAASKVVTYTTNIGISDVDAATTGAQSLASKILTVAGSKLTSGTNILSDAIFKAVVAAE